MPSFGDKLKQEREKRKFTLEQISATTKIGTRLLQALEEDKFNQLPGGIFNKGFVRAYARFIGLDEDQTVAEYLQASGDAPPVATEIPARVDGARESAENISRLEAISEGPRRQLPRGLFAGLLLVIALGLWLWSRYHHRTKEFAKPVPITAGESSHSSASKARPSAAATIPSKNAAVPLTTSKTAQPPPSQNKHGSRDVSSQAGTGQFQIAIQTSAESWISLTVDGNHDPSEIFPAGSTRTVRGRKQIVIKVGNAGGVNLRFNGKTVDFGGKNGEVKTITFGLQGVLPNAAEPTLTP